MSKMVFDEIGSRLYETGCDHVAFYPTTDAGAYGTGVAWNGVTSITQSPSGGEPSPIYADNIKYANLMSNEECSVSLEAYMYPEEFEECDGSKEIMPGVYVGQQKRKTFGLAYRTIVGNDTELNDHGYKIHIVYGCLAAPSEKGYTTIGDSSDPTTFSWEVSTTPVSISKLVDGKALKPTSTLTFDSTKFSAAFMKKLEDTLYGTDSVEPTLPLPDALLEILESVPAA